MYNDTVISAQTLNFTNETPLFIVGNGTSTTDRSNALLVQQDGNIGVNANSPKSKFVVNGALGLKLNKETGSGAITLDNSSSIWYFTGTATIVLPVANTCSNRIYTLVNRTSTAKSISSYTSISGVVITSLSPNSSIDVISDGTDWLQIR
jgi:hypothetical protein